MIQMTSYPTGSCDLPTWVRKTFYDGYDMINGQPVGQTFITDKDTMVYEAGMVADVNSFFYAV